MKKAQTQQVFTYIMAILVIGAILFLGIRAIAQIFNKQCDVADTTFKRDIDNAMRSYDRLGNMGYEEIRVPCDYDKLCFLSIQYDFECENIDDTVIKAECLAKTNNNVFIKRGPYTEPLFSITNLIIDHNEGYFCVEPKGNRYHLKFEGIGRGNVKVSENV